MTAEHRPSWRHQALPYAMPALAALVMLTVGALSLAEPWAPICLAAGLLSAALVGLGASLRSWLTAVYGVLFVAAAGLVAAGALLAVPNVMPLGVLALIVVGAATPIAMFLERSPRAAAAAPAPASDHRTVELLRLIHENSVLSDNAKRVLFRERELGLLRHAIETDLAKSEYSAALTLCDEMANVFGYREEAETFRARIEQARQQSREQEITGALDHFDGLLEQRDWAIVHQEAARIRRLWGDSHRVLDLDDRIMRARDRHKDELERSFLEAARRDDVATAMDLLRQLDRYLDRVEAERLTEVAQGVVVRHRENLGVQFKLAVNDHRWAEAARIGEVIIAEFPNTKMADEVRSMIDLLRTRASQAALAN